jgi:O-acetyl-ADP-ribose deacetylase (regulator of RNase III)
MSTAKKRATCFVIMPFGEKADVDGKVVEFDKVYKYLIKNTIEALDIDCVRCDEIDEAGWIHRKMFEHVYAADIAVVDITQLNPNVFYELGVRHAVADRTTVLIKQAKTKTPFNVSGLNIIEYDSSDLESVEEAKKKIANHVQNGLRIQRRDSPVQEVLGLRVVKEPKEIPTTEWYHYNIRGTEGKQIGIVTGDLINVKGIDVWVSSENTNMEMARHFDRSISSIIRYYGAKRNRQGRVVEDLIADELAALVHDKHVPPGHVVATTAGALRQRNGVKRIFHAAAVHGQIGKGYSPIADIADCVRNALELADDDDFETLGLTSMLFPIMGTGTGRADVGIMAPKVIHAAESHLMREPPCRVDRVYFVCRTEEQLEACQVVLQEAAQVTIL